MYIQMYIIFMANRYSIAQARSNLATIVNQAESGRQVELTRRGKSVAVVMSFREFESLRGGGIRFRDVYREFLKRHIPSKVGLENDFSESLRDRGNGRKVLL